MKIELGHALPNPQRWPNHTCPRFLVSAHRRKGGDKFFFRLGRLYVGYIGLMALLPGFEFNVWIYNLAK
jgi:hypothetical protein